MTLSTDKELRELDAWIAEHVMGWMRCDSVLRLDHRDRFAIHPSEGKVYIHVHCNNIAPWVPTEDPAAAMQVLERCCNAGTQPAVGSTRYPNGKKIWRLACDVTGTVGESAETLPIAICRFARALFARKDER